MNNIGVMQSYSTRHGPARIRFPSRLTFASGCGLVETIRELPSEGRHVLDLADMQWVEPFAMLHVASAVGRKLSDCPNLELEAIGCTNDYARFMGFFRELGLPAEADTSPPANHENYLPIQVLNLREIRADAERRGTAPGEIIEGHTRGIARTLARQNYGKLWQTLQYALREIIRNAAEHSQCDHVLYCGQFWPSLNRVEVAILDEGIGIYNSLRKNPKVRLADELMALRLSLEPGISGVAYEGAELDETDKWTNSGFGLFIVSELCRRGGSLTLISGDQGLCVSSNDDAQIKASHAGTALRLVIDTSNLRSIAASLALIVSRGEEIAKEKNSGRFFASGASKMIFD